MTIIYFIEGVTCSGKSDELFRVENKKDGARPHEFARESELYSFLDDWAQFKPVFIPETFTNPETGIVDRQTDLFHNMLESFLRRVFRNDCAKNIRILADYSPFGCIPFTSALATFHNNGALHYSAQYMKDVLNLLLKSGIDLRLQRYLRTSPDEVIDRMKRRNRKGDAEIAGIPLIKDFFSVLCSEYDRFFMNDLQMTSERRVIHIT